MFSGCATKGETHFNCALPFPDIQKAGLKNESRIGASFAHDKFSETSWLLERLLPYSP